MLFNDKNINTNDVTDSLEARWPPRSPHEALLSSPSGRSKLRQHQSRTSPSPSPLKNVPINRNVTTALRHATQSSCLSDEDEDEETLQLELKALEARLKLKRLQQQKRKKIDQDVQVSSTSERGIKGDAKENRPPASREVPFSVGSRAEKVQIAASPQKRLTASSDDRSPKKVLLGIDKGLTGRNVSLRKGHLNGPKDDDPFRSVKSSKDNTNATEAIRASSLSGSECSRGIKTFSERIAETRQDDKQRQAYAAKIRKERSKGFGIQQDDLRQAKESVEACVIEPKQTRKQEYSRDDILRASSRPDSGLMRRSTTTSARKGHPRSDNNSEVVWRNPNAAPEMTPFEHKTPKPTISQEQKGTSEATSSSSPAHESSSDALFEPFSSTHLSRRALTHDLLTRTFGNKSILLLPHLLKHVQSPSYTLPADLETDYVVLATIASKSAPLARKDAVQAKSVETSSSLPSTATSEAAASEQNTRGKFMVLKLTDLKWTLDLYLFDTAYTKFWKLDPGTVVALLNPSIMPPPPHKRDTGQFSLTLNSSDDTILEIGTSRDLGWCTAVRKDGKHCTDWIDKRHTSVCEFHVDRAVEKTRSGRMEIAQGMNAQFAPGGKSQGRTGHFGSGKGGSGKRCGGSGSRSRGEGGLGDSHNDGLLREGKQYDRWSHSNYFMAPPSSTIYGSNGPSVAERLDAELGPLERGGSKEERLRKQRAAREREDEIAKRLGEAGNGAGSEYLRLRRLPIAASSTSTSASASSTAPSSNTAAGSNGPSSSSSLLPSSSQDLTSSLISLRTNKAQAVHLSPLKKQKRKHIGQTDTPPASPPLPTIKARNTDAKREREAEGEKNREEGRGGGTSLSPRKKTRFVTEKGIREAGRDSLGVFGSEGEQEQGRHRQRSRSGSRSRSRTRERDRNSLRTEDFVHQSRYGGENDDGNGIGDGNDEEDDDELEFI